MEEVEPDFSAFPYKPYSIQLDFMKSLYRTGIICGALQWVVDRKEQMQSEAFSRVVDNRKDQRVCDDEEPDWMKDFVLDKPDLDDKERKNKKLGFGSNDNEGVELGEEVKRKSESKVESSEEEEFLVEEYESDDGNGDGMRLKRKAGDNSSTDDDDDGLNEEEQEDLKLSQFVKELMRTVFANQLNVVSLGSRKNMCINEEVLKLNNSARINEQCLELQKNKNSHVSKVKVQADGGRIRKTKASAGCPMLKKHKLQKQFKTEASEQDALDIEDLILLGNKIGTCPYYDTKMCLSMTHAANLVVLPYQSLLFKSARESLGLKLKNSIIIIDEAHNLADSLTSMYDSRISFSQLEKVHRHLELYFRRFRNLLGGGNRRYIQTLMVLTRAFLKVLLDDKDSNLVSVKNPLNKKTVSDSSMAINDFLFLLDIDNINLVKLRHYIKESNIIHKVSGYGAKRVSLERGADIVDGSVNVVEGSTLSGFQAFVSILQSLTNSDGDGRIISRRRHLNSVRKEDGYLKYVMLSGEKIFSEIVEQAHAVVLAGGTLQPIEETRERLFPWLLPDKLHFFSCGHIVPPESIFPIAVSQGPSSMSFDFSYSSRTSSNMIEELGRLLCSLVTVVPEGMVMFFSSYEYEAQVHDAWKSSGTLARIMKKKHLFREPRSTIDVDAFLRKYKETALTLSGNHSKEGPVSQNGAMLLAVVGGKISEGINFSDGMGRCVVMVGLPYPSPSDVELLERVKHIEGLGYLNTFGTPKLGVSDKLYNGDAAQAGFSVLKSCNRRGREYYENLCMNAVNQSIGRVIRHANDYAAIL
ncbi:hypothetical protein MKX01_030598 [Papaver californicum]|nr:hypothetical protein MKX01_030598 [Papaver californicum]